MSREIASARPDFTFCGGVLSEPAVVKVFHTERDDKAITGFRDKVSDSDCGAYRQCFTKPSAELGCGAKITSLSGKALSVECPAGTGGPYVDCAKNVAVAITRKLKQTLPG